MSSLIHLSLSILLSPSLSPFLWFLSPLLSLSIYIHVHPSVSTHVWSCLPLLSRQLSIPVYKSHPSTLSIPHRCDHSLSLTRFFFLIYFYFIFLSPTYLSPNPVSPIFFTSLRQCVCFMKAKQSLVLSSCFLHNGSRLN